MKTIQYKVSTWMKMELPDDIDLMDVIQDLKDGVTPLDIFEQSECQFSIEPMIETEYLMNLEENNGDSTIEVYDCENCAPIWTNEVKKYATK